MTSMATQVLGSILPQAQKWIGGGESTKKGEESVQSKPDSTPETSTPATNSTYNSNSSPPSTMPTVIKKYKAAAVTAEPGVGILFFAILK